MGKLKIGVILPSSNYIPLLAKSIKSALQLGLESKPQIDFELCIEPGGYTAEANLVIEKAQKLIFNDEVHAIVAPLNVEVTSKLKEVCDNNEVPLLVLSLGEDPWYDYAKSDFIFVNSLNLWESSWLTGNWAGNSFGKSGACLASIHEGGYNLSFAFAVGLESVQGVLKTSNVTHRESRTEDSTEVINLVLNEKPDFLFKKSSA